MENCGHGPFCVVGRSAHFPTLRCLPTTAPLRSLKSLRALRPLRVDEIQHLCRRKRRAVDANRPPCGGRGKTGPQALLCSWKVDTLSNLRKPHQVHLPYDRGGWEGWSKLRSAASPSRSWRKATEGSVKGLLGLLGLLWLLGEIGGIAFGGPNLFSGNDFVTRAIRTPLTPSFRANKIWGSPTLELPQIIANIVVLGDYLTSSNSTSSG